MIMNRRTMLAAAAGLAAALGASGAMAKDTLRVGAYPANPPWQNKLEDGSFQGFEVDIVNEIGARMDRDVEIAGYDFRALFVATASGRVDMVISSLTITPERLESQSFTQPYVEGALGVGVKNGEEITSLEGLEGKRVGAIATSFGEAWIKEREGELKLGNLRSYDTVVNMLTDLRAGRVDAVVNDAVGLRYAFTQSQGLNVSYDIKTGERFAMMFPKNSPLLEEVNEIISEMKRDGTMAKLYERWLGSPPAQDSLTVTPLPVPAE